MAAVYFVFRDNARAVPKDVVLEQCMNREHPGRMLQQRARTQHSRLYPAPYTFDSGIPTDFPEADMTASMMIWIRRTADPLPLGATTPDEVWTLTERGAVIRSPFAYAEVEPEPAPRAPLVRPVRAVREPRRREPRRRTVEVRVRTLDMPEIEPVVMPRTVMIPELCPACYRMPHPLNGSCGCS